MHKPDNKMFIYSAVPSLQLLLSESSEGAIGDSYESPYSYKTKE